MNNRFNSMVSLLKSKTENETDELFSIINGRIALGEFTRLAPEERYTLAFILKGFPKFIDKLCYFSEQCKEDLNKMNDSHSALIGKILGALFIDETRKGTLFNIKSKALKDGPSVILLVPSHGNALVGNTLGQYNRNRKGAYPPTGPYHVSSILNLMGIRTYLFDFDIGKSAIDDFKETVFFEKERLKIVSISSRFMAEAEFEIINMARQVLRVNDISENSVLFTGGGIGPGTSQDIALMSNYLDIVTNGYSPFSLPEIIFDCIETIKTENYENLTDLFGQVANLSIRTNNNLVLRTHVEDSNMDMRALIAEAYNIAQIPYESTYWPRNYSIAVCSPDDLNIMAKAEHDFNLLSKENLHLLNYLFKPRQARLLSVIGNCPRNCRFCHWHTFDSKRYLMPYDKLLKHIEHNWESCPSFEMIGWLDEDFLIWKRDIDKYVSIYRESKVFPHIKQTFETLPQYLDGTLLDSLHKANFKAIYLGYESPIQNILLDMRKLRPNESYENFMRAPYLVYDSGFVCRCSTMTFYPLITEEELYDTLVELINLINYGISIEINPYVVAVPGSEMSMNNEYQFRTSPYTLKSGKEITFKKEIIPNDPIIAKTAEESISNVEGFISDTLKVNNISGDHSMSFEVLSFFLSIVSAWKNNTKHMSAQCEELHARITNAISLLKLRHELGNKIYGIVLEYEVDRDVAYSNILQLFKDHTDIHKDLWYILRMLVDFGDIPEIIASMKLAGYLLRNGFDTENYSRSVLILTNHRNFEVETTATNYLRVQKSTL